MKRVLAALLHVPLLLTALAHGSRAQTPLLTQPIDSGRLVQIQIAGGEQVRGRLLARFGPKDERVIFCRYPGNPCTDSAAAGRRVQSTSGIVRLDIAGGSRAAHGAVIGGLIGLGMGLLEGALIRGLCDSNNCPDPTGVTVAMTAGGALWGAIFGSTTIVWRSPP